MVIWLGGWGSITAPGWQFWSPKINKKCANIFWYPILPLRDKRQSLRKPSPAGVPRRAAVTCAAQRRPAQLCEAWIAAQLQKKNTKKLREKAPATRVPPLVIDVCIFSSLGCSNPTLDLAFKASARFFFFAARVTTARRGTPAAPVFIFSQFDWICCNRPQGVCLCVCVSVCVISTAQTSGPILMKLYTNHLQHICSILFSPILNIHIWWRHCGHYCYFRFRHSHGRNFAPIFFKF